MSDPVEVSFEFFPPSDEPMGRQLWESVQRLAPLQPNFVSVTYGADGSTRTRTHECVLRILRETHLTVAPHLTCVAASRAEVLRIAQDYWQQGVRHLVALRGDVPGTHLSPEGRYRPHPGGFERASAERLDVAKRFPARILNTQVDADCGVRAHFFAAPLAASSS